MSKVMGKGKATKVAKKHHLLLRDRVTRGRSPREMESNQNLSLGQAQCGPYRLGPKDGPAVPLKPESPQIGLPRPSFLDRPPWALGSPV